MNAELPTVSIDRDSPLPFYFQLKDVLERQILDSHWLPGDQVPSEAQLCEHFELSRTTVRQALDELEQDGLVRRERGRGTFVAEPNASAFLQSTAGFFEEATRLGHDVRSRVLRREVAALPDWAATALELDVGSEGVVLERLRWLDDEPVMYVHNYLPERYAAAVLEADLETGSLYATLREAYDFQVAGGRRTLHAAAAEQHIAALLQVDPGSPLLLLESISWGSDDVPLETYVAWHVSDRARIAVHVVDMPLETRGGLEAFRLETRP